MHELHELVSMLALQQVALEVITFISIFQVFCTVQSWIGGLFFTGVLLWLTGGYHFTSVVVYAVLAIIYGYATARAARTPKDAGSGFEVAYYVVQPFLLVVSVPLFVAQTRIAVGYPLGFLAWLGINLVVFYLQGRRFWADNHLFVATFVPVIAAFVLGFLFDDNPWVAVGITLAIQTGVLLYLFKKTRK